MTEPWIAVPVGLVAGLALGVVFFGGLRWTVERLVDTRRPALVAVGSFALRLAATAGGITALAVAGGWIPVVAAVAGMLAVRTVLIARARKEA